MIADFRQRSGTVYHPVATCRMGPDPARSVVDPRLRVHGIAGLRIIDASVFPVNISGNTNAADDRHRRQGRGYGAGGLSRDRRDDGARTRSEWLAGRHLSRMRGRGTVPSSPPFLVPMTGGEVARSEPVMGHAKWNRHCIGREETHMKITDVKTWVVGNPPPGIGGRYFIFVKLTTDGGVVGYGEAYNATFGPHVTARMIEDFAERYLVGRDPHDIETFFRRAYSSGFTQRPDIS